MIDNSFQKQNLNALDPLKLNKLTGSISIPSQLTGSLSGSSVGTNATNLGRSFLGNLGNKALGGAGKLMGGGMGDVMGVASGISNFFSAQGNTAQKQMQRGDAAVDTVSAGLSFVPGFGQAAGVALKLVNSIGGKFIKEPGFMKNYATNQNVMQNASAFGGVAAGAQNAESTKGTFAGSGLLGKLIGKNNTSRNIFKKATDQQFRTQGLLNENQTALDNANSSADMFTTRNLIAQQGNYFNRGAITFGQKGMKFSDNASKFYQGYLSSPNYKKRLSGMGDKNPNATIADRKVNLQKTRYNEYSDVGGSYYNANANAVILDTNDAKTNSGLNSLIGHEYSHASGALSNRNNKVKSTLRLSDNEASAINSRNKSTDSHDSMPHEAKADIDALRYRLKQDGIYDTGTQDFNQQHLNKAKQLYKKDQTINRSFQNFSDKDLTWLMNNVASTQSTQIDRAQKGMKMRSDGSFLGNLGAKAINYLNDNEQNLINFRNKGREVIDAVDVTGVTQVKSLKDKLTKGQHTNAFDYISAVPAILPVAGAVNLAKPARYAPKAISMLRGASVSSNPAIWGLSALGKADMVSDGVGLLNSWFPSKNKDGGTLRNVISLKLQKGGVLERKGISAQDKKYWNGFVDFVKEQGYSGNPDLNSKEKNLSRNLWNEYGKTKGYTKEYDKFIPLIQTEIQNFRQSALNDMKAGNAVLKGYTKDQLKSSKFDWDNKWMPNLSEVDGWAGTRTTSFKFPAGKSLVHTPTEVDTTPPVLENANIDVATSGETNSSIINPSKHKDGGSIKNVIVGGELHARKHSLNDLEEFKEAKITKKGVPVVVKGDGGSIEQTAEVEREELIFHIGLTNKIEKLYEDGSEEAAIEAGKLLSIELTQNLVDNTDVLEKIIKNEED